MAQHSSAVMVLFQAVVLPAGLLGAGPAEPLHALLVTGGCCHDYDTQTILLTEGISARANVSWTIVHEGGTDRNHQVSLYTNANWAGGYDVVVHNECFGGVSDDSFVEGIAAAHQNGVAAVMLHCAIHSYRVAQTDAWRQCLGISSYSHETRRDIVVTNLFAEHPVMRGFPQAWLDPAEELYLSETIWPDVVPLAQSYGQDTLRNHVVIWVNTYGRGRVFGTTLGHGNETVGNGVFLDLVTRGLLWACGRLDEPNRFRIRSVQPEATRVRLTWESVPGWPYNLENASAITGPWQPLYAQPITATNVLSTRLIPNLARQRFFRLQRLDNHGDL